MEAVLVQLPNEAGEVAVLEVVGQYLLGDAPLLLCQRQSPFSKNGLAGFGEECSER